MVRREEKTPARGGVPLGCVSVARFAQIVGVTPPRINMLIKRGRIEGVQRHDGRYVVPEDARILPAKNKMPGPVTDYVESWHRRNDVDYPEGITQKERERVPEALG